MIVAVEGIDGAGKRTLVDGLLEPLQATSLAFPRYDESAAAQLAQAALHGEMGDMTDSAHAMAVVFALDRHGALPVLERYAGNLDETIILDRYCASNAAYTWARTGDAAAADWVAGLEFDRLGLPKPDLQVLVATTPEVAGERAAKRETEDAQRTRDRYERDRTLQEATFAAYEALARQSWASPWVSTTDSAVIIKAVHELR